MTRGLRMSVEEYERRRAAQFTIDAPAKIWAVPIPTEAVTVKPPKYRNKKSGMFGSRKEERRYRELELLQASGAISGLRPHPEFLLIPPQRDAKGRILERSCKYIADASYVENGALVVEDTKSRITQTPTFVVKRKLLLFVHGIQVKIT
jgi:hypothetical protein